MHKIHQWEPKSIIHKPTLVSINYFFIILVAVRNWMSQYIVKTLLIVILMTNII